MVVEISRSGEPLSKVSKDESSGIENFSSDCVRRAEKRAKTFNDTFVETEVQAVSAA